MKEHIDENVISSIISNWNDKSVYGFSFIDFKKYEEYIDYIYEELEYYGLTRDDVKLSPDFMGLTIDYIRE